MKYLVVSDFFLYLCSAKNKGATKTQKYNYEHEKKSIDCSCSLLYGDGIGADALRHVADVCSQISGDATVEGRF